MTSGKTSDMMTWILLAWSLLLTIILIAVIISIACVARKYHKDRHRTIDAEAAPARPDLDWREKSKRKSLKSWINPHLSWRGSDDKDSETASDVQLKDSETASVPDVHLRDASNDVTRGAVNSGYEDEENWMGTMKSTTETTYSNETLNRDHITDPTYASICKS